MYITPVQLHSTPFSFFDMIRFPAYATLKKKGCNTLTKHYYSNCKEEKRILMNFFLNNMIKGSELTMPNVNIIVNLTEGQFQVAEQMRNDDQLWPSGVTPSSTHELISWIVADALNNYQALKGG